MHYKLQNLYFSLDNFMAIKQYYNFFPITSSFISVIYQFFKDKLQKLHYHVDHINISNNFEL